VGGAGETPVELWARRSPVCRRLPPAWRTTESPAGCIAPHLAGMQRCSPAAWDPTCEKAAIIQKVPHGRRAFGVITCLGLQSLQCVGIDSHGTMRGEGLIKADCRRTFEARAFCGLRCPHPDEPVYGRRSESPGLAVHQAHISPRLAHLSPHNCGKCRHQHDRRVLPYRL
jgi:hypothetical protein